jgi:hypothetical protein
MHRSPSQPHAPAVLAAVALAFGCAGQHPPVTPAAGMRFPADTFAFANQTVWEYAPDPASGAMRWTERRPRPPFSLRCGNMARAVRQFRVHARFEPAAPRLAAGDYRPLVREVLRRSPRARRPSLDAVPIPGFADLRSFSAAHEALLQAELRGPWQSYVQRGNWRMIFPFTAGHQEREAERLQAAVARGEPPIVHVLRFPDLTLNHVVVIFGVDARAGEIGFQAYDPNDAAAPITIVYDRGARTFHYPRTPYFGGGPIRAYEIYDGALY